MTDKLLYANDLIHRFASHTFTETTVGSQTKVEFKNGSSVLIRSAQKLNAVDAYHAIRHDLLDSEEPDFISTTTQRDALSSVDRGTIIYNTTIGRTEVYNGTKWINVSRRSVAPAITASTTQTQGNGLITDDFNVFTIVANDDDTATLPTATSGISVIIIHKGDKKLQLFPNTGDDLGEGINQAVLLAKESNFHYHCFDTTTWELI